LPLLLADPGDIVVCAAEVSAVAWCLARHFWPGPLTLVVRRAPAIPDIVSGGMDTVAVRVPDHPVPRAVVRSLGAPITGTSANRSGGPAPTSAGAVLDQLGEEVDYVIDAGECPVGVPSTVLDVTRAVPVLLRAGAVDRDQIEDVIGLGVIVR
jgi:L-threonylcarbamoyladenylate synthase